MQKIQITFYFEIFRKTGRKELYITFLEDHISSDGLKLEDIHKNLNLGPHRGAFIHQCQVVILQLVCAKKATQCMHVLDSPMYELETLNTEQKQAVDDITDRIVELEKVLASQLTVDYTITFLENKLKRNNCGTKLDRRKFKKTFWLTSSDSLAIETRTLHKSINSICWFSYYWYG